MRTRSAVLLAALTGLSSCAAIIKVDGQRVIQTSWEETLRVVSELAAVDLKCDAGMIDIHLVREEVEESEPLEVTAKGCDQTRTYLRESRLIGRGAHAPSRETYGPWAAAAP